MDQQKAKLMFHNASSEEDFVPTKLLLHSVTLRGMLADTPSDADTINIPMPMKRDVWRSLILPALQTIDDKTRTPDQTSDRIKTLVQNYVNANSS